MSGHFTRGEQSVGVDKRHFSLIKEKREGLLFWRGQKTLVALHEEKKCVAGGEEGRKREREKGFSLFSTTPSGVVHRFVSQQSVLTFSSFIQQQE
jgi:hypothetical protein